MGQIGQCIFRLALSHTRRSDTLEKREENSVDILAKFACGQVSSPRLCRLTYLTRFWLTEVGRRLRSIPRNIPVLEAKKVKALRYFSKNLKNLDGYLEETSLMFSNKYS